MSGVTSSMLEKLVHGSGRLPPNQHYIEITVPGGTTYEVLNVAALPDWHLETCAVSKPHGDAWQQTKRSAVLLIPSVVARIEWNVLINPEHPEFPRITASLHLPVWWDRRLFAL